MNSATDQLREEFGLLMARLDNLAGALSHLVPTNPQVLDNFRDSAMELLKEWHVYPPAPMAKDLERRRFNYAGMQPRDAIALDLAIFGEGRSIDQLQQHVFDMGLEKTREGRVRFSLKAPSNADLFTVSEPDELVNLTEKGKALARQVKARLGIP